MNIIVFFMFIVGIYYILDLKLLEMSDEIYRYVTDDKAKSIKQEVDRITKKKKVNILKRQIYEAEKILRVTKKEKNMPFIFAIALLLAFIGITIGGAFNNIFLSFSLGGGFLFLPFLYLQAVEMNFKREVNEGLEASLSLISTTYIRNENFIRSVEENIDTLNPMIQSVFKEFLFETGTGTDIYKSLINLRTKIDNTIFKEWVDRILSCQNDITLKSTLLPIVKKLSDMRIINSENEVLFTAPRQEFFTMIIMVVIAVPLASLMEKDWYTLFINSIVGKIALSLVIVVVFISTYLVIKITKPMEYK